MAKDVKRRFTVSLDIDTKDAEKQVKATAKNLKTILSDLGNASDKMSYFKELVDYISQIDKALDSLKKKDGDAFAHMFDGLDANLRKELENLFGTAKDQMSKIEELKEKVANAAKNGASVDEIKALEAEIKSIYQAIGQDAGISGRGKIETRIQKMQDALNNFAVVWDGVNDKVKQGLGGGTGNGTGDGSGSDAFSKETQDEIDQLEQQIKEYQKLLDQLKATSKMKKNYDSFDPYNTGIKATEENAKNLIEVFKQLNDQYNNFSGDKNSLEYQLIGMQRATTALQLNKMHEELTSKNELPKDFIDLDTLDDAISSFSSRMMKSIQAAITNNIASMQQQVEKIKQDASQGTGNGTSNGSENTNGKKTIETYDEIIAKVKELNSLISKRDSLPLDDQTGYDKLDAQVIQLIQDLSNLHAAEGKSDYISNIFETFSSGDSTYAQTVRDFCNAIGIDLPDDMKLAQGVMKDFFNTIQGGFTTESIEVFIGQIGQLREQLDQLHQQGKLTDVDMQSVDKAWNDVSPDVNRTLNSKTTLKDLQGLYSQSGLTNESDELNRIIQQREDILSKAKEERLLTNEQVAAEEKLTASIKERLNAQKTGSDSTDDSKKNGNSESGENDNNKSKNGEQPATEIDFSKLESTITTESEKITSEMNTVGSNITDAIDNLKQNEFKVKLEKDPFQAIQEVQHSIDEIVNTIKAYNDRKAENESQSEVDAMKSNLTKLLETVNAKNSQKNYNGYSQGQELSASFLSNGSIAVNNGEKGTVPWDRVIENMLSDLSQSLTMDVHSHPWQNIGKNIVYANDMFSGAQGDLGAARMSKNLGADVFGMITGNIMRTLDISKLTEAQMNDFRSKLSKIEQREMQNSNNEHVLSTKRGELVRSSPHTLQDAHEATEAFESMMYEAFEGIGFSKDQVNQQLFKKYNLTDDTQLTELATRLVELTHAAQNSLSPIERLIQIIDAFGGDTKSKLAQTQFESFNKGEISAADVVNKLTYRDINKDAVDSIIKINSAAEPSATESLLSQVISVLSSIESIVSSINTNTQLDTNKQLDQTLSTLTDLKQGKIDQKMFDGIQSLYDGSNVTEYKTNDIYGNAKTAYQEFQTQFRDLLDPFESYDFNDVQNLIKSYMSAVSNILDAQKQVTAYENRTGDYISNKNGEKTGDALSRMLLKLTSSNSPYIDTLQSLIREQKGNFDSSFDANNPAENNNEDRLGSILENLNGAIDNLSAIISGLTGIKTDQEQSVEYQRPEQEFAQNNSADGKSEDVDLTLILAAIQDINKYLSSKAENNNIQDENDNQDITAITEILKSLSEKFQTTIDGTLSTLSTAIDKLNASFETKDNPNIDDDNNDKKDFDKTQQDSEIIQFLESKLPTVASEETVLAIKEAVAQVTELFKSKQENDTTDENNVSNQILSVLSERLPQGVATEATLGEIKELLNGYETKLMEKQEQEDPDKEPDKDVSKEESELVQVLNGKIPKALASEETLSAIRQALELLTKAIEAQNSKEDIDKGSKLDFSQLIRTLVDVSGKLKEVASGIVQHQQAQKSETQVASARIANKEESLRISSIAQDTVKDLGTDIQIAKLQALKNGIVQVEGVLQNADGIWEGFTVRVNEAGEAVDLIINKQSQLAKQLNKEKEKPATGGAAGTGKEPVATDEVYKKALARMTALEQEGKKVKLSMSDSGKYIVAAVESIGNLTKTTTEFFDDTGNITAATVKLSNALGADIEKNKNLIDKNKDKVNNAGLLEQYNNANQEMIDAEATYQKKRASNPEDPSLEKDIALWNEKIQKVQMLGNEIAKLIAQQQKLDNQSGPIDGKNKRSDYSKYANELVKGLGINAAKAMDESQQQIYNKYSELQNLLDQLNKAGGDLTEAQKNDLDAKIAELKSLTETYRSTLQASNGKETSVLNSDKGKSSNSLTKYMANIKNSIAYSDEFDTKLQELKQRLATIDDTDGLGKWKTDFAELQAEIDNVKTNKIKDQMSSFTDYTDQMKNAFGKLPDELKDAFARLKQELKSVTTQEDMDKWQEKFSNIQTKANSQYIESQRKAMEDYKKDLNDFAQVPQELQDKFARLQDRLGQGNFSTESLQAWIREWKSFVAEMDVSQGDAAHKAFASKTGRELTGYQNSLKKSMSNVGFDTTGQNLTDEQQKIVDNLNKIFDAIDAVKTKAGNASNEEIANIRNQVQELQNLIATYKQEQGIFDATRGTYGSTIALNATAKKNYLSAQADRYNDSPVVSSALNDYIESYNKLIGIQNKFTTEEDLSTKAGKQKVIAFKEAQNECNKYAKALETLINSSDKLESIGANRQTIGGDYNLDNAQDRERALKEYIQTVYGSTAEIGNFKDNYNELLFTINNGDGTYTQMTASLNAARTAILSTTQGTEQATSAFGKFVDELKGKFQSIAAYLISMAGFQEVWQQIRQGISSVTEIDTALTELKKVTNETDETYAHFLQTASQSASLVGSTVKDLTNSTADWARLGYNLQDASALAQNTSILMNVSEFENIDDATNTLISALQAFKSADTDVGEYSMKIIDEFNEIGNNYAISTSDLAESLTRSSATLFEANNSLEESVAMTAAANTIIQDPDSVGNALKTVAMRIRGVKSELEDAGEETDGVVTNTAKLQSIIKSLTSIDGNGGIDILTDTGDFKSTYEILLSISKVWDKLDDKSKAGLLESIAGKNRASVVSALLENGDVMENAYQSAIDANGSAANELESQLNSIQGRVQIFQNALQSMWMNMIDSSFIKGIVDIGTAIVNLADKIGILGIALSGLGVYFFAIKKNNPITIFKDLSATISNYKQSLSTLFAIQSLNVAATPAGKAEFNAANIQSYAAAVSGLSAKQQVLALSTAQVNKTQIEEILRLNGVEEATIRQTVSEANLANAKRQTQVVSVSTGLALNEEAMARLTDEQSTWLQANAEETLTAAKVREAIQAGVITEATGAEIIAKNCLTETNVGLAASMKALILTNPVGFAIGAISTIVTVWSMVSSGIKQAKEESRQALEDLKSSYNEFKDTNKSNVNSLTTSSDSSQFATLEDEFRSLARGVDKYGNNISLTSDQYERYRAICQTICDINPSLASGYDDVTKAVGNNVDILKEMIKAQQDAAVSNAKNLVTGDNLKAIKDNATNDYKDAKKEYEDLFDNGNGEAKDIYSVLQRNINPGSSDYKGRAQSILEQIGFTQNQIEDNITQIDDKTWDLGSTGFSRWIEQNKNLIAENAGQLPEEVQEWANNYQNATNNLNDAKNGMIETLLEAPKTVGDNWFNANDSAQSFINTWIKSSEKFKWESGKDAEQMVTDIQDFVNALANGSMSTIGENGEKIDASTLIDNMYDLDPSKVNWGLYRSKLTTLSGELYSCLGDSAKDYGFEDGNDILSMLGLYGEGMGNEDWTNTEQTLANYMNTTVDNIRNHMNGMNAYDVQAMLKIDWDVVGQDAADTWDEVQGVINSQKLNVNGEIIYSYDMLSASLDNYNSIAQQTNQIQIDNTKISDSLYSSLASYIDDQDALNEIIDTSNGNVVTNAEALRNLVTAKGQEAAANANVARSQYMLQYYQLNNQISDLINESYNAANGTYNLSSATLNQIDALQSQMDAIQRTIAKYGMLEQQLLGTADAFTAFQQAQTNDAATDYVSQAEEIGMALMKAFETGDYGTETAQAAFKALVPESVYEDLDTFEEKWQAIIDYAKENNLSDYFTIDYDDDGMIKSVEILRDNVHSFIADAQKAGVFTGSDTDNFELADGIDSLDDVVEKMKKAGTDVTKEMVFAMFKAIDDENGEWIEGDYDSLFDKLMPENYNLDSKIYSTSESIAELNDKMAEGDISSEDYREQSEKLEETMDKLKSKAKENVTSYANINDQIAEQTSNLQGYKDGLKEAQENKDKKAIQFNTDKIDFTIKKLQELYKEKEKLGEPTPMEVTVAFDQVNSEIEEWKAAHSELDIETNIIQDESGTYTINPDVEISDQDKEDLQTYIDLCNAQHTISMMITGEDDSVSQLKTVQDAVEAVDKALKDIDDPDIDCSKAKTAVTNLKDEIDKIAGKEFTTTITTIKKTEYQSSGSTTSKQSKPTKTSDEYVQVNGSANLSGSAHASGNWGIPTSERRSLVGELGPETVVDPHTGRYYTVGDNGAELVDLPKGAIIFNHKQTEDLFNHGYITSRGKIHMDGSAYVSGNAHVKTPPIVKGPTKDDDDDDDDKSSSNSNNGGGGHNNNNNNNNSSEKQIFDWFAVMLEELTAKIEKLNAQLKNTAGIKAKNSILGQLQDLNDDKIDDLTKGIARYEKQANKLLKKVDKDYRKKAQDGSVSLSEFKSDSETLKAIQDYREWAKKVEDLKKQLEEAKTEAAALATQKIDLINTEYGYRTGQNDLQIDREKIKMGTYSVSGYEKRYDTQLSELTDKKKELDIQHTKMLNELNQAVKDKKIKKGSDEWWEAIKKIQSVYTDILKTDEEISNTEKDKITNLLMNQQNKLTIYDSKISDIGTRMSISNVSKQSSGYEDQVKYLKAQKTIEYDQYKAMQKEFNKAVKTGKIKKGSEDWWDVTKKIQEAYSKVLETAKKISETEVNSINAIATKYQYLIGVYDKINENYTAKSKTASINKQADIYAAIENNTIKEKPLLQKQYNEMKKKLEQAVASGKIVKGSDDWWKVTNQINDLYTQILNKDAEISSIETNRINALAKAYQWQLDSYAKIAENYEAKMKNSSIDTAAGMYDRMISSTQSQAALIRTEYAKLLKARDQAVATGKIIEGSEDWCSLTKEIRDLYTQIYNTDNKITDLEKQKLDAIGAVYDKQKELAEADDDLYKSYNDYIEKTTGSKAESIYNNLIKNAEKERKFLEDQRDAMSQELQDAINAGKITIGSDVWYEEVKNIRSLENSIISINTDISDLQDSINELHWNDFETVIDQFEALKDEADDLVNIMSNKDLFSNDGSSWTKEGLATLGLYVQQMENAEYQADQYRQQINYLNGNWQSLGMTQKEYYDKLQELTSAQRDQISAYYDAKDAIVDLNSERANAIKDGIQDEIDAYQKLVDKKKEELNAEKDLHDFRNTVNDQAKSVADLEKQLAAMSADTSAATVAKRKQLEAQLYDAKKELEETYYDHSKSEEQEALDKSVQDMQDALDEKSDELDDYLEDTEQVIKDSFDIVKSHTSEIYSTLSAMGIEYGLTISSAILDPWLNGQSAIQGYSEQFGLATSATISQLDSITQSWKALRAEIEKTAQAALDVINNKNNFGEIVVSDEVTQYGPTAAEAAEIQKKIDQMQAIVDAYQPGTPGSGEVQRLKQEIEKYKAMLNIQSSEVSYGSVNSALSATPSGVQTEITTLSAQLNTYLNDALAQQQSTLTVASSNMQNTINNLAQIIKDAVDKSAQYSKGILDISADDFNKYIVTVEQKVKDCLAYIQQNTTVIYEALTEMANKYNVALSDAIINPWLESVVSMQNYSNQFVVMVDNAIPQLTRLQSAWGQLRAEMNSAAAAAWQAVAAANAARAAARESTSSGEIISSGSINQYASGSSNISKNQIATVDELGEELILHAGANGRLEYLSKGSGVVTSDLTSRLMEWGQLDPSEVLKATKQNMVNTPSLTNTTVAIDASVAELIHIDNCTQDSLPELKKIVSEAIDKHTQKLNQSLRKYVR